MVTYEVRYFECDSDNSHAETDWQLAPSIVRFTTDHLDREMLARFGAHRLESDYFNPINVAVFINELLTDEAYLLVREVPS